MSRPLRDRLAEAIRRCRIGNVSPPYLNLPDEMQEEYRRSADMLAGALASEFGFSVKDERGGAA